MKIVAFFGNKAGTGTSLLVYHLAWMYAKLDYDVLVADLDPQAGLTEHFLDEKRLEQLWGHEAGGTVYREYHGLLEAGADADADAEGARPYLADIADGLALLPGDLSLGGAEEDLADHWRGCQKGRPESFRATAGFFRVFRRAAREANASLVLIDAGSSLGAVARATMLAADEVVVTVQPDPSSLRGLANVGPALRRWRTQWQELLSQDPELAEPSDLPPGIMRATGYVVWQRSLRLDRPLMRRLPWLKRIPADYRRHVLGQVADGEIWVDDDPYCLGNLMYYLGLMPIAHDARKPVFDLKPGDGLIGDHMHVVVERYHEYRDVAERLAERCGVPAP